MMRITAELEVWLVSDPLLASLHPGGSGHVGLQTSCLVRVLSLLVGCFHSIQDGRSAAADWRQRQLGREGGREGGPVPAH